MDNAKSGVRKWPSQEVPKWEEISSLGFTRKCVPGSRAQRSWAGRSLECTWHRNKATVVLQPSIPPAPALHPATDADATRATGQNVGFMLSRASDKWLSGSNSEARVWLRWNSEFQKVSNKKFTEAKRVSDSFYNFNLNTTTQGRSANTPVSKWSREKNITGSADHMPDLELALASPSGVYYMHWNYLPNSKLHKYSSEYSGQNTVTFYPSVYVTPIWVLGVS